MRYLILFCPIFVMATINAEIIDKKNIKALPVLKLSPTQTVIIENEIKDKEKKGPLKLTLVCNKEKRPLNPKLICQTVQVEKL